MPDITLQMTLWVFECERCGPVPAYEAKASQFHASGYFHGTSLQGRACASPVRRVPQHAHEPVPGNPRTLMFRDGQARD